ncbi:hypothetical protein J7E99_04425 [Streptomyces sp. ISL-44]|nr:hypothetical protein [Streptomyces sp. ISL-44]
MRRHGPHQTCGGGQGLGAHGNGGGKSDNDRSQPTLAGEQPEDSPEQHQHQ